MNAGAVIDWRALMRAAVLDGLLLSLVLTVLATMAGAIALDMFLDKYPREIRDRHGPMSARAVRLRPLVATVLLTAAVAVPLGGLAAMREQAGPLPFLSAFVFSSVALLTWNTFDLIVLDWLVFCTIRPRAMTLPGTRGMAEYGNYRFHFIGFLKGLVFCAVGGLCIASLWVVRG